MRIIRPCAMLAVLFLAAACKPSSIFYYDQLIEGPYRLRAVASVTEMHICYEHASGACTQRIPGSVFAIAHDEDFIVGAAHPLDDATKTHFYYVVRDFDGPRADLERAVRGPYEHDAFVLEMKAHNIPAPTPVIQPR